MGLDKFREYLEKIQMFQNGLPTNEMILNGETILRGFPIKTKFFTLDNYGRSYTFDNNGSNFILALGVRLHQNEYFPIMHELKSLSKMDRILKNCTFLNKRYEARDNSCGEHYVCYSIPFEAVPIQSLRYNLLKCYKLFKPWNNLTTQDICKLEKLISGETK